MHLERSVSAGKRPLEHVQHSDLGHCRVSSAMGGNGKSEAGLGNLVVPIALSGRSKARCDAAPRTTRARDWSQTSFRPIGSSPRLNVAEEQGRKHQRLIANPKQKGSLNLPMRARRVTLPSDKDHLPATGSAPCVSHPRSISDGEMANSGASPRTPQILYEFPFRASPPALLPGQSAPYVETIADENLPNDVLLPMLE